MNIPLAEASHIIVVIWGNGLWCIHSTYTNYDSALTYMTSFVKWHNKKHKRGNVPTLFIFEKKAFMTCFAKPNKPKRIPTKRIPKGVLTMSN